MKRQTPDPTRKPFQDDKGHPLPVSSTHIKQTRTYKVITPLFGGGEKPRHPDSITVVRATEIRGHLRFWWRATCGGRYDTIEEMRNREEEIWGSPAGKTIDGMLRPGKSKVGMRIVIDEEAKQRAMNNYLSSQEAKGLGYATFPVTAKITDGKGNKRDQVAGKDFRLLKSFVFAIEISYAKDLESDIKDTLLAWEIFGGIGARTRRGFGALQLLKIANQKGQVTEPALPSIADLETLIGKFYRMERKLKNGVPRLAEDPTEPKKAWYVVLPTNHQEVGQIHKKLIEMLKSFRQNRPTWREYDSDRRREVTKFGRSHWPEPNAIRLIATRFFEGRKQYSKHEPTVGDVEKFPRARFGLPIVFQFKTGPDNGTEPKETTLNWQGKNDRLASPLIMRPVVCEKSVVGLAFILDAGHPKDDLALYQDKTKIGDVTRDLIGPEASSAPLNGETDVLGAFLAYLESNWNKP